MNRLLFAMARGARIQRRHFQVYDTKQWGDTRVVSTSIDCDFDYRIHPDDEERQYGQISAALRERVLQDNPWTAGIAEALLYVRTRWSGWYVNLTSIDYEVTLLLLAEFLADEGL